MLTILGRDDVFEVFDGGLVLDEDLEGDGAVGLVDGVGFEGGAEGLGEKVVVVGGGGGVWEDIIKPPHLGLDIEGDILLRHLFRLNLNTRLKRIQIDVLVLMTVEHLLPLVQLEEQFAGW